MSNLPVQETAGSALLVEYTEHNPLRTAHFTTSPNVGWVVAEAVAFTPSGAVGQVLSYDDVTRTLSFYLLSGEPALGDSASGATASGLAIDALVSNGDTFINDGRTFMFVQNNSAVDVSLRFLAVGECSDGYLHDFLLTLGPGFDGPVGPFNRRRYNEGGLTRVVWSGTVNPADVGIAAVRLFPSQ